MTPLRAAVAPLALALYAAASGDGRTLHAGREACVAAVVAAGHGPRLRVYAGLACALHDQLKAAR